MAVSRSEASVWGMLTYAMLGSENELACSIFPPAKLDGRERGKLKRQLDLPDFTSMRAHLVASQFEEDRGGDLVRVCGV